jgi:phage terminase large subunit
LNGLLEAMCDGLLSAVEGVDKAFDLQLAFGKNLTEFGLRAFGVVLWEKQSEIAEAITKHPKVACKSGHKVGKTLLIAIVAWWWVLTQPLGRCILSSTTARQVRGNIWREVRDLWRKRTPEFAHLPKPAKMPHIGVQWEDGREIVGFTAREPEAMAGYSGSKLLYVVDEASGVGQTLFDVIEGNLAGGGRIAIFSNPTQQTGYFYNAFNKDREDWRLFTIRSTETPNAIAGHVVIEGLAELNWCKQREKAWGPDSSRYQVKVLGNFPDQGDDTVVPRLLVEQGQMAWEEMETPETLVVFGAIDVARFGDDESAWCFREGMKVDGLKAKQGLDTVELADTFIRDAEERRNGRKVVVRVDTTGVGGGVADYLRSKKLHWLKVIDIVGAASSGDPEVYANLRAEVTFSVKEFLEQGGALPPDDDLDLELGAIKYKFNTKGQILVESKDEIRKADRLGRSPDRADCVCMVTWGFEDEYAGDFDVVIDADEEGDDEGYRSGDQRGFG